jgi:hypothetical protein
MYARLGPSRFSALGFLGDDTRDFEEIVADDGRNLEKLGITHEQLVKALSEVYERTLAAGEEPVDIGPGVFAECLECRGRVPSPFSGEGTFPKHQVRVYCDNTSESFLITALSLHLIERHGFFQGVGSPFRIDPARAVAMLGLAGE